MNGIDILRTLGMIRVSPLQSSIFSIPTPLINLHRLYYYLDLTENIVSYHSPGGLKVLVLNVWICVAQHHTQKAHLEA